MRNYYIFIVLLGIVVASGIIIGFISGGSPAELNAISNDAKITTTFSTISYSVNDYYQTNLKLPESIEEIELPISSLQNPVTNEDYVYNKLNDTTYTLCTQFSTDSAETNEKYGRRPVAIVTPTNTHKKGFDCIQFNVTAPKKVTNTQPETLDKSAKKSITVQYSKLDPVSKSVGIDIGQIVVSEDLTIRVGPQTNLYLIPDNKGYYLFHIKIVPACAKTSTKTCVFSLEDISLKNKSGTFIAKNVVGEPLYTKLLKSTVGEFETVTNIAPNVAVDGDMGFHIPMHSLLENVPSEFTLTYKDSEPLILTLTRN